MHVILGKVICRSNDWFENELWLHICWCMMVAHCFFINLPEWFNGWISGVRTAAEQSLLHGLDPYHLIEKFWAYGSILMPKFNVPSRLDTTCPTHRPIEHCAATATDRRPSQSGVNNKRRSGSNSGCHTRLDYESNALSNELRGQSINVLFCFVIVWT